MTSVLTLNPRQALRVQPVFDGELSDHPISSFYVDHLNQVVGEMFPSRLLRELEEEEVDLGEVKDLLQGSLPTFTSQELRGEGGAFSIRLLFRHRSNGCKFFFEMVTQWLIPGTRLNVCLFHAIDFIFPDLGGEVYTVCELILKPETSLQGERIRQNLPILETEVCQGITSASHARRILEVKGFSMDEKVATIQEHVGGLFRRRPDLFDPSVFTEMQHVLVMCSDEFKGIRECRHISRLIGIAYLFRKHLREMAQVEPERRHLNLKMIHARLHEEGGTRTVLGVIVGVNFLRENESLEERHVLKAVQNYVPGVRVVEGSFFANSGRGESLCTLYVEIEKGNGEEFSVEEVKRLRRLLPGDLKDRIEHLMHPVFMPRNEEETMRHILTLSSQLRYVRDIPQVVISFDQQTDGDLHFSVIMLRALGKGVRPIQDLIEEELGGVPFILDRVKQVGFVRKRYPKEAAVLRVMLPKKQFLRRDNSIDLFQARQQVVSGLSLLVGEIRDFNGGMISKQHELLCQVRDELGGALQHNEFLLENFFYSLSPVDMRATLEPRFLARLFKVLLRVLEESFFQGAQSAVRFESNEEGLCAIITAEEVTLRQALQVAVKKFRPRMLELATTYIHVYDIPRLGYILRSDDLERQQQFKEVITRTVALHTGRSLGCT